MFVSTCCPQNRHSAVPGENLIVRISENTRAVHGEIWDCFTGSTVALPETPKFFHARSRGQSELPTMTGVVIGSGLLSESVSLAGPFAFRESS